MAINKIKTNSISDSAVTSASIQDSAVTNAKISACAAIAQSKVSGLATSLSTLCSSATSLTGLINTNQYNIALLGFKMAITEGLTVFNLVDGIVDEFEDESGVDNSASTSLTYNSTDDYYVNSNTPDGGPAPLAFSAGFTTTTITEPDTSVAGTASGFPSGSFGTFTVPTGMTSVNAYVWGSGGGATGSGNTNSAPSAFSGGGGFTSGILTVTPSQTLHTSAGEGGISILCTPTPFCNSAGFYSGGRGSGAGGGGLSGIFTSASPQLSTAPQAYLVAGSGGGLGQDRGPGGGGGGLTGRTAILTAQTGFNGTNNRNAGGGSQSIGGQGGASTGVPTGQTGGLFAGGAGSPGAAGGGGAGYYGGGGGGRGDPTSEDGSGGGGSSYYGHPQIACGATEDSPGACGAGGGTASPLYTAGTNEGASVPVQTGEDGFVLLTGSGTTPATTTSSTIISDPFTSNTVPTTTRIVVFEENVGTPSLNTDIIASVSRNGGTDFTNVTLADSGYVTGSSGQRILTGTATISGQPSGQSMKWKLQLANNTVKIHGVALQWS